MVDCRYILQVAGHILQRDLKAAVLCGCQLLGDIAGKRFFAFCDRCLPFRSLSVCLAVRLSDTFVHCAQTAEDIDTISFAYDSPVPLPDRVKIWLTAVNPFLPQFCPKVNRPLLI